MPRLVWLAALCALLAGSPAQAMSYGLVPFQDGSTAIVAQGDIEGGETRRLLAFLEEVPAGAAPRTFIISSPGGNMVGAINLGLALRQLGVRTVVGSLAPGMGGRNALGPGRCHSACVLVLMGGVNRLVMPGSQVGVHSPQVLLVARGRAYRVDGALTRYMVQGTEPVLRSYAYRMGVSPAVIDVAHRVSNTSIRRLSPSELAQYRLVTTGEAAPRRAAQVAARRNARSPRGVVR